MSLSVLQFAILREDFNMNKCNIGFHLSGPVLDTSSIADITAMLTSKLLCTWHKYRKSEKKFEEAEDGLDDIVNH